VPRLVAQLLELIELALGRFVSRGHRVGH
jgi:hypothetical protein